MTASRGDEGAGSVLVVGIAATVLVVCGLLLPLYMGLAEKRALAGAADAAALAAADALSGAVPGFPCDLAEQVAARNGASLTSCELAGSDAIVAVSGQVLGLLVRVAARAGPPPEHRDTLGNPQEAIR